MISGGNANSTVQVNLVPPGTLYGERLNQLDLRVGKIVKVGRTRTAFNVDLYNALNVEPGHRGERDIQRRTDRDADAAWLAPQSILTARFVKFSVQLDF